MEPEGVGVNLALYVGFYYVVDLLVGVVLVGAHVDEHLAAVGDDVVLRAGVDNGESHLRWAEELAHLLELIVLYPNHVVEGLVNGVHALVSRGVPALSVGNDIEHHQALLGYGGLHARGLAHYSHVNLRKQRQGARESLLARHLFFG